MTFVLVGRVQAEYLLAKGLFSLKDLLNKNEQSGTYGKQSLCNKKKLTVYFSSLQTNLYKTKYNIHGESRTHPFTKESTELFITRRKWISMIRR